MSRLPAATHTPSREVALARLAHFAPGAGRAYASTRNFDYGPDERDNVSLLSPHIRHRLLLESEVLAAALAAHSPDAADKFVQEVFWRAYFKGWLEHRPEAWTRYRSDLVDLVERLDTDPDLKVRYDRAVNARTGIDCFDAWVEELIGTGYLHNHARMWFASIWVFTLELPWQLGADFFYRHLMDGDAASNTLSWRWVCGLHTPGKTYLARVSNIMSYTNNRFNPDRQLAASAPALTEAGEIPVRPLPEAGALAADGDFGLLVTEEDCAPESLGLDRSPVATIGVTMTSRRSQLPVGLPARAFALGAVADALERAERHFDVKGEQIEGQDLGNQLAAWAQVHGIRTIATAYAPVGPVADALGDARVLLASNNIELVELRRAYDDAAWPHARKGFFKLKSQIPAILEQLGISAAEPPQMDLLANAR